MYFKDLTKYTYMNNRDSDAINIGWLDHFKKFPKGEVSDEFLKALQEYYRYPIFVSRGFHACNLCHKKSRNPDIPTIEYGNVKRKVGYYELRILGKDNKVYAAPSMIYHYITKHNYLPPQEFIEAVLSFDEKVYVKFLNEDSVYAEGKFWWEEDRTLVEKCKK